MLKEKRRKKRKENERTENAGGEGGGRGRKREGKREIERNSNGNNRSLIFNGNKGNRTALISPRLICLSISFETADTKIPETGNLCRTSMYVCISNLQFHVEIKA